MRDPERPLLPVQATEPLRLPRTSTIVDVIGMVLVVGLGAAAFFGFNAWATSTNFWWDACADKFCAEGHDLRLFVVTFVGGLALAGGLFVPILLSARLGGRPLRSVFAIPFVLIAAACMAANVILAWQSPIQ